MPDTPDLIGKTFTRVFDFELDGSDALIFENDKERYTYYHAQDCCESVHLEDIVGDVSDLENTEILVADEVSNSEETENGSETWTFYKFRTIKGSVDVRWYGSSNGYYSESVNLKVEQLS